MPDTTPVTEPPRFDNQAQERAAARFRECPPEEFLRELAGHAARTRDEIVAYEKFFGWALYEAGDYPAARQHLLVALRRSRPGTRDRAIVRGLLGELALRTGQLEGAERCAHRALSQLPLGDEEGYLRSGYLSLLGRVYRRQGHLTHAVETYRRALAMLREGAPHWLTLNVNLSVALFMRGNIDEADALIGVLRRGTLPGSAPAQGWGVACCEADIALARGELEHAEQVLDEVMARFEPLVGDRVADVMLTVRAMVHTARGDSVRAERIFRNILEQSEVSGRRGDSVPTAARGLAEALEHQHRFDEAIASARLAIRAGSLSDRVEWAIGLHVLGRCQAALGRTIEARRAFQEALSVHDRTEFGAERARLIGSIGRLGFGELLSTEAKAPERNRRPVAEAECLHVDLADGRTFLTVNLRLLDGIELAAASRLPVLIEGETGTGKELVARLLHERGPLARRPFVVVDCATLSAELADVELFGAARGAYTGAHRDRAGLVAQAESGTLFLDELPELSSALQAKLLRAIQEGTYRRVGEDVSRRAEVRFVAATNRSIDDLLRSGALKPDLYYRLNGHRITLEPLRNRPEEIGPIAEQVLFRSGLAGITPGAVLALQRYHWPGNVRQLEMILRVAACRCAPGATLDAGDLALESTIVAPSPHHAESLRDGRIAWERDALVRALAESDGIIARAARTLGLTRQAFYKAMRRTGLRLRDPQAQR